MKIEQIRPGLYRLESTEQQITFSWWYYSDEDKTAELYFASDVVGYVCSADGEEFNRLMAGFES